MKKNLPKKVGDVALYPGYFANKKVIAVVILTLVALGYLTIYTFLPSLIQSSGPQVNPESLKPAGVGQNNVTFAVYHNKDLAENFYSVSIPQSWQLQSPQSNPGEYVFGFNGGSTKIELMDVPDNSTLELFILSQDEPRLKTSLKGYEHISYQGIRINSNEAYQLHYLSDADGTRYESIRTYIAGQDHAAVITFSAKQTIFGSLNNTLNTVLRSFSWG